MSAESTLLTINKSLTAAFGAETYYNFSFPNGSDQQIETLLRNLSASKLALTMLVEHDGVKYISTIPSIRDSDIVFYSITSEYQSTSGTVVEWRGEDDVYPRIVGKRFSHGTGFEIDTTMTNQSAFWVIEESPRVYSAINYNRGDIANFNLPLSNWRRNTGKKIIQGSDGTLLIDNDGKYISSNVSYDNTKPLQENDDQHKELYISKHKKQISFFFIKNNEIFLENSNYAEDIKVTMAVRFESKKVNSSIINRAFVLPGPINIGSFYDIANYIDLVTRYTKEYVVNNPFAAYGTEDQTGEERVATLRVLGYV